MVIFFGIVRFKDTPENKLNGINEIKEINEINGT